MRQSLTPPQPTFVVERVGEVVRCTAPAGASWGCFVEWSRLDESTAPAVIAEQVDYFGRLGLAFEWKTYGYDTPSNLPELLLAAKFVAEDEETLVLGLVADVVAASTVSAPMGVLIRAGQDDDWDGIAALNTAVWGGEYRRLVTDLAAEVAAQPDLIRIHVAEVDGQIVCAAWVRFHPGTDFASMWGGSTHPDWRGRGIYRTLVGLRAAEAADRGYHYLQVDCSADSRPILERLGMHAVTTTTPYVWSPTPS